MQYRRSRVTGGSYFFTLVTYGRQPLLTSDKNIERLREAFTLEMARHPFEIEAIVILPDHLHVLWQLPEGDSDYSKRWGAIKKYFSIGCRCAEKDNTPSRRDKRESNIWQRRFWEHTIRDQRDWNNHLDYIHHGFSWSLIPPN